MKTDSCRMPVGGSPGATVLLCMAACMMHTPTMSSAGPPPGPSPGGLPAPPLPSSPGTPETAALLKRLVSLADEKSVASQEELARELASTATLDKIDAPRERAQRTPRDLRVARVFDHLRENHSPAAAKTLATLTSSKAINDDWRLQALLIRAFADQRPLLPEAVDFLNEQSHAKSLNLQTVIAALVENESAPATALLGRKLAVPALDENIKISWIRYHILPRRRSVSLLRGVEKWLTDGKLDGSIRNALADTIFDYRPREWGGTELPTPPNDSTTSPEAAEVLRRIGKLVTASNCPGSIKTAVSRTLDKLP